VAHLKGEPLLIWMTRNNFIYLNKLKVMNIFYINEDPIKAAQELADDHIRKMQIESAQMCCTAHWETGGTAPYKRAHKNHPSTIWVRQSIQHYRWLIIHGLEICNEFEKRYGKSHKTKEVLEWCKINEPNIPDNGFVAPPQCMDDIYKSGSALESYRKFYIEEKIKNKQLGYNKTPNSKPEWIK
jgi:hypothetical protein